VQTKVFFVVLLRKPLGWLTFFCNTIFSLPDNYHETIRVLPHNLTLYITRVLVVLVASNSFPKTIFFIEAMPDGTFFGKFYAKRHVFVWKMLVRHWISRKTCQGLEILLEGGIGAFCWTFSPEVRMVNFWWPTTWKLGTYHTTLEKTQANKKNKRNIWRNI
jgi:hypothetical protein